MLDQFYEIHTYSKLIQAISSDVCLRVMPPSAIKMFNVCCVDVFVEMLLGKHQCLEETNPCNQTCVETTVSYFCECRPGYLLDSDKHSCIGEPHLNSFAISSV